MIFASDLDNTLIYSYKKNIEDAICVEYLNGCAQSFCTKRTINLLQDICDKLLFVPITARSLEQYKRITWPERCKPYYAVTTNGAILLENNQVDVEWLNQSKTLVDSWKKEMWLMEKLLSGKTGLKRVSIVDEMYLYAVGEDENIAQYYANLFHEKTELQIEVSGRKIYLLPLDLNKGNAVERLRQKFGDQIIISAGDSQMDIAMLQKADISIFPHSNINGMETKVAHIQSKDNIIFSDYVLQIVQAEMYKAM